MSSPIRMTGLTSGLDTESIVTALTSGYKSKVDKYKQQQTKVSWKQDAWKDINKKVYSLYTSLDSMRFSSNWKLQKATSSNTSKATVSSNGKAFTGSQTLRIASVATSAMMTGGRLNDNITGSSTLADLGYTEGTSATITVNGKSFAVDSSTTLNSFASSLQSNGLNANFDTASHRFFISSKKSGAANDFSIEGDANGVTVIQDLGLLSGTKSTKAKDTYGVLLGDTLEYSDVNGLTVKSQTSGKTVDDLLTTNIDAMAKQYNDAITNKDMYNGDVKKINEDLSYVRTFKNYNANLSRYAASKSADDIDALDEAVEKLVKIDDTSFMVGDTEYKLVDKDNGIYSSDLGNTNYKKNDDGSYSQVSKNDKGEWTAVTTGKTIAKSDVTSISDYRLNSDATKIVAKKLYDGKTYDQLNDSEKSTVANAVMSLVNSRYSIDSFENATENTTTSTIPDDKTGSDSATAVQSREKLIELVKGKEWKTNYTASKYSDSTADDAISTLNKASQYWKSEVSAQDAIIKQDSLVASFASKCPADGTAAPQEYTDAVDNLKNAAKTAFANQSVTNNKIDEVTNAKGSFANKIAGADAKIYLNGQGYTQASNNFTINGLTINVTGVTENAETKDSNGNVSENGLGESITITTQVDSQGLYDKIKNFFSTYNDAINELTDSYNAESSKGYDPLTDDQKSAMSDTEVEKWEKKAKAGLLRNDSTLNSIMNTITNSMLGTYTINGKKYSLATFGIMTKGILNSATNRQYEYHIDGDEDDESVATNSDKLLAAINEDPDSVIEFMQKLTNDLYQNLDKKMKRTSLKTAYTIYNDKEMASEYSSYNSLISQWEDRLSTMEESYYKKFSQMESTLSKLQSSTSSLTNSLS